MTSSSVARRQLAVRARDLRAPAPARRRNSRHVLAGPRCAGRRRRSGRRGSCSRSSASRMMTGSNGETKVRTARRSTGGVAISDHARARRSSASCSVRGIGVAVSVSTCTSARSSFSRSLWATPKCCSSSTISRPRSLEADRLAEQRVRADDDVDGAVLDAGLDGGLAPWRRPGATAWPMRTGRPWKRSAKVREVLARQQRRRHHHRHLLAGQRGDEGGAQRHLGLAEADVAADQPVHRLAGGQVLQHVADAGAWSSVSA